MTILTLTFVSAQLAQANAEAQAAQAAAYQQPVAVAYAAPSAPSYGAQPPQQQAYAPPAPPTLTKSSSSTGRQMLNEVFTSGEPSVDELVALKKQLNVTQVMCVSL